MGSERQRKDRTDYIPNFSLEERDRRWGEVRGLMYQRGLDALVVWGTDTGYGTGRGNLRYLTQVPGQVDAVGIFPREGEPTVFADIPHLHQPYTPYDVYQDWVDDVRVLSGMGSVAQELKDRELAGGDLGLVGLGSMLGQVNIPYQHVEALRNKLPRTEFSLASDIVGRARLIKSDEEIEFIKKAAENAEKMADALMNAEPGQTEREVYADMIRAQIASDGSESYVFNLMDSGSPMDPEYEHLLHGKMQPISPSDRTLNEDDLIVTEFHANYGGYLVAVEKSVVLGAAPEELKEIHEVCLACEKNGMKAFTPGTRLEDVWKAIREPAEEAGMNYVELGFHGHGLGSPEFPTTVYAQEPTDTYPDGVVAKHPMSGRGIEDVRLQEGMVFGMNIDLHNQDWRDDVGLMYGSTILVTEDGPERLVGTPKELEI